MKASSAPRSHHLALDETLVICICHIYIYVFHNSSKDVSEHTSGWKLSRKVKCSARGKEGKGRERHGLVVARCELLSFPGRHSIWCHVRSVYRVCLRRRCGLFRSCSWLGPGFPRVFAAVSCPCVQTSSRDAYVGHHVGHDVNHGLGRNTTTRSGSSPSCGCSDRGPHFSAASASPGLVRHTWRLRLRLFHTALAQKGIFDSRAWLFL